jgi:enhancing lycopene biosynthesis protein 2
LLLAGCGVHDGSEVHEAVLAMLTLDRAGATIVCTAPNVPLREVIDHQTGERNRHDTRAVLSESARIARGPVTDVAKLRATDLDALVVPGGYGTVKNLSDYAIAGRSAVVHTEVARLIREMHAARKPMAFLCTAPVIAARVLAASKPTLTIGRDVTVAGDVAAWGAQHETCDVKNIVVDRENKIVSTPAYMLAQRVSEAAEGIDRAVRALLEL